MWSYCYNTTIFPASSSISPHFFAAVYEADIFALYHILFFLGLSSCTHLNTPNVSWHSVWLGADEAITPDVYRSFSLCWIYFYKSIQICFCAAYCTRGVNVLYKAFRSGIRFSPNSISQFSVLSGAFIILTVADKAIIFPKQLQNVDKCFCDSVSVWGGEHKYYSTSHWWHILLATKWYPL